VNAASRSWRDANGDYVPQASELGPLNPSTFGQLITTTRYGADVLTENRPYSWQAAAAVQHELHAGVAVNVAYFRTWWNNFRVSAGRTETNNCFANGRPDLTPAGFVANTPRVDAYCNVTPPFSANTQLKLNGAYPLPLQMMVSAVYQNIPGIPVIGSTVFTSAD